MKEEVAQILLDHKAVKSQPDDPFTWVSGIISPIYCDNRKTLSYPEIRTFIKKRFIQLIKEKFIDPEVIAGVATGAIAQGALIAEEMKLPFIYVRSSAKSHGLQNQIEGDLKKGQRVVIVEDLISTGTSSLNAVKRIRSAEAEVLGMVAIFTYGFDIAFSNFDQENCKLFTLSNYETLIQIALSTGYINKDQLPVLKEWRNNPSGWNV